MITTSNENLFWIFVILSFWITRIFNPLGITPGDFSRYTIPPESTEFVSHVIIQFIYWNGGILFGREIIFILTLYL